MLSRPIEAVNRRYSIAGKSVASRTGEAYDARDSGPIGHSRLWANEPDCVACSIARKEVDEFTIGN
jgi:hypothetical protein